MFLVEFLILLVFGGFFFIGWVDWVGRGRLWWVNYDRECWGELIIYDKYSFLFKVNKYVFLFWIF